MATEKSFMMMIESSEIKLLIDSLMLLREKNIEEHGSEDPRITVILSRIITHGRVPYCKHVAPDAYRLCFPDGPEYAEELASDRFKTGRPFLMMIESYETDVVIESLMLTRENDTEMGWTEDHRIKPLLRRIMSNAGLPYSKSIAPDAYDLCFSEGRPRYGTPNK